ncbi:chemotaxis protein CheC [Methanocaldococcus infernus]|nr:chemotaxis protein CheC [Methanocaldococcus infernus]
MKYGKVEISPKSWEIIVKNIIEDTLGNGESKGKIDLENLSKIEEVGKFASEKAMRFISDMTGYKSCLKVFNVRLITPSEIMEEYGDEKRIFTKIDFSGDIKGSGILIFSEEDAIKLAKAMLLGMGMESDSDEMDEMKISAINEICNILISAYVDSFANFMKTSLTMTPPEFITGSGKEVLKKIFEKYNIGDEIILAFRSTLHVEEVGSQFDVLIVLPQESVTMIFEAIRKGEINDKLSVKYDQ